MTDDAPEHIDHPSLHALQVLKHDTMFGVFSPVGDIAGGAEGLYANDTRVLSRWTAMLPGMPLKFLSGGASKDGLVLTHHLANGATATMPENTLHVSRTKFMYDGYMYERLSITNHGLAPVPLDLTVTAISDFKDLFEVRGLPREKHGAMEPPIFDRQTMTTRYTGLDGIARLCRASFSHQPRFFDGGAATFSLSIEPQETWKLDACVSAHDGKEKTFDAAMAALREGAAEKRTRWLSLTCDNPLFQSWADSSIAAIDLLTTEYDTGPYPCAGIPWFSVPFGRDGIITALQTLPFNPSLARGVLAYLAAHQATEISASAESQPGKILHETRASEMANTGEVAFGKYYGSVDSTPLFLMLAGAYADATGDRAFIDSIRPSLNAALAWIETYGDPDGDGFLEYKRQNDKGLATQGWKDSHDSIFHADGGIATAPVALCEVQGYAYAAFRAMARLSGDAEAARLNARADALYEKFNDVFWIEDGGFYALALDGDKRPCKVRTSNMGHLLWCGIVPRNRATLVAAQLMSNAFFTGFGIRTAATDAARYNPLSYHNGTVWPHDTAIAAAGLAAYGFHADAARLTQGLFDLYDTGGRGFLPELFGGFARENGLPPVAYPTACNPQAWASGAFFMLVSAALGITVNDGVVVFTNSSALKHLAGELSLSKRA